MKNFLLVMMLLFTSSSFADANTYQIYTIPLKHRTASELLPQLQAFIPEDATISAYQNTLLLKSDRQTWDDINSLLTQLDTPLQSVIVTVARSSDDLSHQHNARDQITVEVGDTPRVEAEISRWSTHHDNKQNAQFRSRGIAGHPISISLGQDIPIQQQIVFIGPRGVYVDNNTQYISASSGFQAVPYLYDDNHVKVEIHPFYSRYSANTQLFHRTTALTTVSGKIGEWIEVGYIGQQAHQSKQGVTSYHSDGQQSESIFLKIEVTP
jgi:hypothetical protein